MLRQQGRSAVAQCFPKTARTGGRRPSSSDPWILHGLERDHFRFQRERVGLREDLGELLTGVIDYDTSGRFRCDLAEKRIHAKIKLAELGVSIGGELPYSFRRWLIGPDCLPAREVDASLAVLARLHEPADPSICDHATVGDLFRRVDAKPYLSFGAERQGQRTTSALSGGILTFGSTPPPGPWYDGPTDRAILRQRLANGEPVSVNPGGVPSGLSQSVAEANWSANLQRGTTRCSGPHPPRRF